MNNWAEICSGLTKLEKLDSKMNGIISRSSDPFHYVRVEITNPGGSTGTSTEAEFGRKSHSRNPLIFWLFVRIQMIDK